MKRNLKLILGVLFLVVSLLLGLFKYNGSVSKDSRLNFQAQSIEYWNNIMKECELDIDYIVEWFESNKRISGIHLQDGNVCYERSDEILFDLDSRITEFIKKNDVDIVNPEEEDGDIICFAHNFFNKKRIMGQYVLIYYKDERTAQDSYYAVRDDYYKIKSNYYCYVTFYE